MENEEEMKQEQTADTAKAEDEAKVTEQTAKEEPQKTEEEEKFTQSQVNDIVTRRLAKQAEAFYKKYGVNDEEGLNAIIGKAKDYDNLSKKYGELPIRVPSSTKSICSIRTLSRKIEKTTCALTSKARDCNSRTRTSRKRSRHTLNGLVPP